jgi:hypothetical protein
VRSRPPVDRSEPSPPKGGFESVALRAVAMVRLAVRPLVRMWDSDAPLDAYALVHMASAAGDGLVSIALADSVFFSLPVGQARVKVALYLALTMAPLAVAAPVLAPLLDRGGFRRAISFGSAAGRAVVAVLAAPRFSTLGLFPLAFALLVLSKVHGITKNGLTSAYAPSGEGLVRANGRLGRMAVVGVLLGSGPGLLALKLGGAASVLYLAAAAYVVGALLNLRLPQPAVRSPQGTVDRFGRVPALEVAAVGAGSLRGASGYILFLLAFALRGGGHPPYWFGVLAAAGLVGGFLGDLVAPRLPADLREERVVLGSLVAAGVGAVVAYRLFTLPVLAVFSALAGMATELGRLAFQSLMQRWAPARAQGRVFVRYEVAFQLAWVGGALLPALIAIPFRVGILLLAGFYLLVGASHVVRPRVRPAPKRRSGGT